LLAALAPSCVIGRPTLPSRTESAQGPLAPPVTGAPVVPTTLAGPGGTPPDKGKPGAVWVDGYWHWDGVRYVWQRGSFRAE
jgi:hypothetical protein